MSEYDESMGMEMGDSILDVETGDAIEPAAVEAGEYKVRITGFKKGKSGNNEGKIVQTKEETGNKYFIVNFDIPEEPASKGFSKIFSVPVEGMDAKRLNGVKWELECLKRAFNLPELNFNEMVGKEGYALLKKTSSEQYGEQNDIVKFITGA
jgi:hypothetical protein